VTKFSKLFLILALLTGLSSCDETTQVLTIQFDTQGGEPLASIEIDANTEVINLPTPVKSGHMFIGWFLSLDSEESYVFQLEDLTLSSITLYARWEEVLVDVTFVIEDTSYERSVLMDSEVSLDIDLTKEGYTFDGWYVSDTFTEFFTGNLKESITLFGRYIKNSYTITYEFNTSEQPFIESYLFDDELSLLSPSRDRYQFLGWYKDQALTMLLEESTMPSESIILYAKWEQVVMTITLDSDGGTLSFPNVIQIGKNLIPGSLEIPLKTGHTFLGWFNVLDDQPHNPESLLTRDVELIAKYDINSYNLTLVYNNNLENEVTSLEYLSLIPSISTPTKVGHTFLDWFSDSAFTNAFNLTSMPAEDITLYAKWQALTYTMTFNVDGGSLVNEIKLPFDSEITKPIDPTKDKHQFLGWFLNLEDDEAYVFDRMPAQNVTLIAKWKQVIYTISLNSNGGTLTSTTLNLSIDLIIGGLETPSRLGYTFDGWYEENVLFNSNQTMPERNINLTASWKINSYHIYFDTDGGSPISSIELNYQDSIILPSNPTKEGHEFASWDVTAPSKMPANDLYLKATWNVLSYDIIYKDDQNNVLKIISIAFGTTLLEHDIDNPTKLGHTFKGWDASLPNTMPSNDLEFIVLFEINTYTIEFVSSETIIEPVSLTYDAAIVLEPIELIGYLFEGYYTDSSFESLFSLEKMPANDLTVYVRFTYEGIAIRFNTLGGTLVQSIIKLPGETIDAPTPPTRSKYEFLGWYKDENYTEIFVFDIMPDESLTLYAKWKQVIYTITLDADGGIVSNESLDVSIDLVVGTLETPTKEGYTFIGWFEGELAFDDTQVMPERNISLIAKWRINNYTITFDSNGGSEVQSVTYDYGQTLSEPTIPTKEKHIFLGWKLNVIDTNYYVFETMPANNITLIADWKLLKDNYITFNILNTLDGTSTLELMITEYVIFSGIDITISIENGEFIEFNTSIMLYEYNMDANTLRFISTSSSNYLGSTTLFSIKLNDTFTDLSNIYITDVQLVKIMENEPKVAEFEIDPDYIEN